MFLARAIAASRRRFDLGAADYFARIVAAGSSISEPNKAAVNAFVTGCKADGIWSAIKASCLLAGPDTLAGALVPLVGPAPTNFNFVAGDYNRVTGLKGNGSNKRLNSNRANNADPQNNRHIFTRVTDIGTSTAFKQVVGTATNGSGDVCDVLGLFLPNNQVSTRCRTTPGSSITLTSLETGSFAINRISSNVYTMIFGGVSYNIFLNSETPTSDNVSIFDRSKSLPSNQAFDGRLSFYSIGESLDLAKLDARITTYMASIS
jgi:hypothetical protein